MTPLLLAALAVLFAGPVPAILARWHRLRRTPRAAMLLWQSVALAAVLAALGAGVSLVTTHARTGRGWLEADPDGYLVAAVAFLVTALVLARLLLSGHRVGTALRARRRQHREQLELVADREDGLRVIAHEMPVAYCVPGLGRQRIVVSAGALGRLSEAELAAVVAHERAHLRARHDLVLEAFSALREAFPRWVGSRAALEEVQLLVEVLADRAAARRAGARVLAHALVELAGGQAPEASLGVSGARLLTRVELLADDGRHRPQAVLVTALAVAVLLLPTAFVVVPWLRTVV